MSESMQALREAVTYRRDQARDMAAEAMHLAEFLRDQVLGITADAVGDTHPDILGLVQQTINQADETAGALSRASGALDAYAAGLASN